MVDKQNKAVVVDDPIIDSNIRKKEHEKLEKYQGLKGLVVPHRYLVIIVTVDCED